MTRKKPKMDLDERIAAPIPAEELVKAVLEVDPESEPVDAADDKNE